MHALRRFRMLALMALVAALLIGFVGASAVAGDYATIDAPSDSSADFGYGLQPIVYPPPPCWVPPRCFDGCHNVFPGSHLP